MSISYFKCFGFSLIELAVVLFIISLILGGLLPPLATQIEQREREKTQEQLDEIKQILYGFTLNNNRLPCPDCRNDTDGDCSNPSVSPEDGLEDVISGDNCATEIGYLPWATLNIKGLDAWGEEFTYRVTNNFADSDGGTGCSPSSASVSFSLCSNGDISILNEDGGAIIAQNIPAVVLSHGNNGDETFIDYYETTRPSIRSDEDENYDDGRTGDDNKFFVYKDYVEDEDEQFDDLIIWISPHLLRTKMLNAGLLP